MNLTHSKTPVAFGRQPASSRREEKMTTPHASPSDASVSRPKRPYLRGTPTERFWFHVDKSDDCWIWRAGVGDKGYGRFHPTAGKTVLSHRFAWETVNGPIPPVLLVLHSCDNPPCVRPTHLFLGTHQDNSDDMLSKRRQRKALGSANAKAKLTEAQIPEIRHLRAAGLLIKDLASLYSVHQSTIQAITSGRKWKHVA